MLIRYDLLHLVVLRMRETSIVLLLVNDISDRRQLPCLPTLPQVIQVSLVLLFCTVDGLFLLGVCH